MVYNAYYGANFWRQVGLTREQIIMYYDPKAQYLDNRLQPLHIYCPATDKYVSSYFKEDFFNLKSIFSILMFDMGASILSKESDIEFKWRLGDDIIVSNSETNDFHITKRLQEVNKIL